MQILLQSLSVHLCMHRLHDKVQTLHNLAGVTILVLFLLFQVRYPPLRPKTNSSTPSEYAMASAHVTSLLVNSSSYVRSRLNVTL